ncbi:MAG: S41 family peptidase [Acidobacteria bacterium]|nr:S41 family peptidase [Acidobacteriota bacterium]
MKKNSTLCGSFLVIIFLVTGVFAQNETASKVTPPASGDVKITTKSGSATTFENIERDVAKVLTLIEDNHVDGKKLNYNELFKSSIDKMLHTLDPHSNYFDAKEFEQFRTDQSSQYFGIGATIGHLRDASGKVIATFIKATFEGAPANRANLRYGDKIVEVNGVSMLGKPLEEVRTFLRGPRGTPAKLVVEKYGTGTRETIEIVRDAVSQPSIAESYMLRPEVGYIAMTGGFNQTTYAEFVDAMRNLKAQGMKQLVIDLRGNGGGLVHQAYKIANIFLPRGQAVFTQKGRINGTGNTYDSDNDAPEDMPLVVLVNRNSASASEILAGALQDHDRALIVGEDTFGKGLVQNPYPLEYGSMLLLTIAKYETPSGRLIQKDYSDGNLYNYYTNGGTLQGENESAKPKGAESKTDSGRTVYGGGGINPDKMVKPQTITTEKARFQAKFNDPIFAFMLDLAYGKVRGFENYKIDRPISFEHDIKSSDFPVTENLFQTFKKFAIEKYKFTPAQINKEREYVERFLRTELITAAYGSTTSFQVFNEYDTQLKQAVESLPAAKQLAVEGARANAQKPKTELNR